MSCDDFCFGLWRCYGEKWIEIMLHTKNKLPGYPGSGLNVILVGGGPQTYNITLSLHLELSWVELGCYNIQTKLCPELLV